MADTDTEEIKTVKRPRKKAAQPEATKKNVVSVNESSQDFLDIEDVLEPEAILKCKIFGKWYDYARRDQWSLKLRAKWTKYMKRIEAIEIKANEGKEIDDEEQETYYETLVQLVKLAIPSISSDIARDIPAESKLAIIVDFLVRTTHLTAPYQVMRGLGAEQQMSLALNQTLNQSIGDELYQSLTDVGLEDGTIG